MTDTQSGKEIAQDRTRFNPEDLRSISSIQDAMRLIENAGMTIADATYEIGDGFTMLEDKRRLVDVPLVLVQWMFAPGDFGGEPYVICRVVTEAGDKYIITDGSTGLCAQLSDYESRTGNTGGLLVKRGLRVSEYDIDETGKPTDDPALAKGTGRTFYLNV